MRSVYLVAWLLVLVLGLGSCGGSALDKYDPAEVEYLRSQAEAAGVVIDEAILVETLEFRSDCRTMKAYVNALGSGPITSDDPLATAVGEIPSRFENRGMVDMADYMNTIVGAAEAGDPQQIAQFVTLNCQDPVSYTHLRAHETDSYLVC